MYKTLQLKIRKRRGGNLCLVGLSRTREKERDQHQVRPDEAQIDVRKAEGGKRRNQS